MGKVSWNYVVQLVYRFSFWVNSTAGGPKENSKIVQTGTVTKPSRHECSLISGQLERARHSATSWTRYLQHTVYHVKGSDDICILPQNTLFFLGLVWWRLCATISLIRSGTPPGTWLREKREWNIDVHVSGAIEHICGNESEIRYVV